MEMPLTEMPLTEMPVTEMPVMEMLVMEMLVMEIRTARSSSALPEPTVIVTWKSALITLRTRKTP